jgi:hypothetical protein
MTYKHLFQIARTAETEVDQIKTVAELLEIPVTADEKLPEVAEPFVLEVFNLSRNGEVSIEDAIQQVKPSLIQMLKNAAPSDTQPTPNEYSKEAVTPDAIALAVKSHALDVRSAWREQGGSFLQNYQASIEADAEEMVAQVNAGPELFWLMVAEKMGESQIGNPFVEADFGTTSVITGKYDRRMLAPRQQNLLAG